MLRTGTTDYPMCLLDTMAVSEMVKADDSPVMRHFHEWAWGSSPAVVPCFTVYTLMELRQWDGLFERFIERFAPWPCAMVKGYATLLEEEVAAYPDPSVIDPCAIAFTPLGGEGTQLANLPAMLAQLHDREASWLEARQGIVDGMRSLVENHQPSTGAAFTRKEVEFFTMVTTIQQLGLHDESQRFARQMMKANEVIDVHAFPSLKAMGYAVFHKFYVDPSRRASESDAFDVLIAAALPYGEAVITERHLAEALRKTKRLDPFINDLTLFTLRDFREEAPSPMA